MADDLYDSRNLFTNVKGDDSNALEVFNGVSGFSGFFSPSDGGDVAVLFERANSASNAPELSSGFLASGYEVQWSRGVTIQRVLNRTQPVAIVGAGSGSLTLNGLLGTYEGFQGLIGYTSAADLCNPIIARIAGGTGFTACDGNGGVIDNTTGIQLVLTNLIMNTIKVGAQYNEAGTLMQQANVVFTIGGFKLSKVTIAKEPPKPSSDPK